MSHKAHEQLPTPPSCSIRSASKRWSAATAAALLTLALGQVARAADGQLDPSFDGDGRVTLDVDNRGYQDHLVGVAVLPDGRIAVGGHTRARSDDLVAPDLDFVIGAFSSVNGSLDTGFGTNGGLTTTDIGGSQLARDEASALALPGAKSRSYWSDDRVPQGHVSLPRCATESTAHWMTDLVSRGLLRHRSQGATRALLTMLPFRPTVRSYWREW